MLTIGEVAARSGVATSALRFYEEQGLIPRSGPIRAIAATRARCIRRVAFIVFAQKVGLSLEEIRVELARLPRNRVPDRADWAEAVRRMDEADPRADCRARTAEIRAHRVHRLRVPVARPLPIRQPRRPRGPRGPGAAVLDRRAVSYSHLPLLMYADAQL